MSSATPSPSAVPSRAAQRRHHRRLDQELQRGWCCRRAPSARRTPISRVRSWTDTSMMFMMPMPPTMRVMSADAHRHAVERAGELLVELEELLLPVEGEVVGLAGRHLRGRAAGWPVSSFSSSASFAPAAPRARC